MNCLSRTLFLATWVGAAQLCVAAAHADVLYNSNGGSFLVGNDGKRPPSWVGDAAAPTLTGSMDVMWYTPLAATDSQVLRTSDAIAFGAASDFKLGFGPAAWGAAQSGHGLDYGLLHLDSISDLTIALEADSGSLIKPALSLYQGWDIGSSFVRAGFYDNDVNNPLGTTGLTYLNQASTTTAGGSVVLSFPGLAAGDYTLLLGGNGIAGQSVGNGFYKLTLSTAAVPVPAAVWLFGSALAGMGVIGRRKQKATA